MQASGKTFDGPQKYPSLRALRAYRCIIAALSAVEGLTADQCVRCNISSSSIRTGRVGVALSASNVQEIRRNIARLAESLVGETIDTPSSTFSDGSFTILDSNTPPRI